MKYWRVSAFSTKAHAHVLHYFSLNNINNVARVWQERRFFQLIFFLDKIGHSLMCMWCNASKNNSGHEKKSAFYEWGTSRFTVFLSCQRFLGDIQSSQYILNQHLIGSNNNPLLINFNSVGWAGEVPPISL